MTVDSTVTVTADSQHDDASDDATATAVTPPESETVNAESATHLRTEPSAAEESVVKVTAYSITLLNADSGDEIDRSISQTPSLKYQYLRILLMSVLCLKEKSLLCR